jgi:mono/diheme cytochrome c family protein
MRRIAYGITAGAMLASLFTATPDAQAPPPAQGAPGAQTAPVAPTPGATSTGGQATPAPQGTAGTQASKSVSSGVYTAEQAKRGEALYKDQCAACHGDKLEGSGPMPALAGADFQKAWKGKTVFDLFDKTHSSMPATAPGSLTEKQTADILAYMFSVMSLPAGTTELAETPEPLKAITFD